MMTFTHVAPSSIVVMTCWGIITSASSWRSLLIPRFQGSNFLTNFKVVITWNHMNYSLISRNPGFEDQIKISLNFHGHKSTYQQYKNKLKFSSSQKHIPAVWHPWNLFFPLPLSAVLHKIDFFHLDGLWRSCLKEHISSKNKQFSLKLKGSSVDYLLLATGFSTLVNFWEGGFGFKYFAMIF